MASDTHTHLYTDTYMYVLNRSTTESDILEGDYLSESKVCLTLIKQLSF